MSAEAVKDLGAMAFLVFLLICTVVGAIHVIIWLLEHANRFAVCSGLA